MAGIKASAGETEAAKVGQPISGPGCGPALRVEIVARGERLDGAGRFDGSGDFALGAVQFEMAESLAAGRGQISAGRQNGARSKCEIWFRAVATVGSPQPLERSCYTFFLSALSQSDSIFLTRASMVLSGLAVSIFCAISRLPRTTSFTRRCLSG
jgi:hypothetical protein